MNKSALNLKKKILELTSEYYQVAHRDRTPFVPGKSRIPYSGRVFNEEELINLVDSSLEFWLSYGRYSKKFEEKFADFIGVKHFSLVNSGSSANLLAFMALTSDKLLEKKINRNDEVITVAAGFPTTIAPIVQYGAVPVFVDIELGTYNIDVSLLEEALTKRTKAVMLAHNMGNPFNVDAVKDFCKKNNLWLIEDNCDALGSKYRGQYTGTFGDIATSSFYPPHHITMGEGGGVYTNSSELSQIINSLRDWGRDCWCSSGKDNTCRKRFGWKLGELPSGYDHKYIFSHFGYNLKATDMQAAIGCAQLNKLHKFSDSRSKNFQFLYDQLKEFEDIFYLPHAAPDTNPCWFGFVLTVREDSGFTRKDIIDSLEKNNIQTRMLFAGNLLKQPCFDSMREKGGGFRVAGSLNMTDYVMNNTFWVGVYPGMDEIRLKTIVDCIKNFVSNNLNNK